MIQERFPTRRSIGLRNGRSHFSSGPGTPSSVAVQRLPLVAGCTGVVMDTAERLSSFKVYDRVIRFHLNSNCAAGQCRRAVGVRATSSGASRAVPSKFLRQVPCEIPIEPLCLRDETLDGRVLQEAFHNTKNKGREHILTSRIKISFDQTFRALPHISSLK